MKYAVALLLVFVAAPLAAQDMQITAWVSNVTMEGEEDFDEFFDTDFDDGFAMGLSINRYINNFLSVEASVFDLRNEGQLVIDDDFGIALGDVNLTPVTLGVQLHLAQRSRIDPYIGAGAAYVLTGSVVSSAGRLSMPVHRSPDTVPVRNIPLAVPACSAAFNCARVQSMEPLDGLPMPVVFTSSFRRLSSSFISARSSLRMIASTLLQCWKSSTLMTCKIPTCARLVSARLVA